MAHTPAPALRKIGAALAVAARFSAKIGLDLALLAQTEVAEIRLPANGKSTTMPHKRNPVGPVLTRACAEHVRAAAGVLLHLEHEHERAAGAWHAEWNALSDALAYTGGAAAALRATLEGLEVDEERMGANLSSETLSEAERFAPDVSKPEDYLRSADALIDRALDFHRGLVGLSTVVLSGSLGATSEMWDAQVEAMRDFDILRIEHPGHGGEPMIELRDVGDLARHVLENVESERFSFVGVSLGGAVGMQLALDAPERLDRLVLACTSSRFGSRETWDARIALVREGGMEAAADVVLPHWFTPSFGDVQHFRAMFVDTPPDVYVRYCKILREFDLRGRLDSIGASTLAIAGAERSDLAAGTGGDIRLRRSPTRAWWSFRAPRISQTSSAPKTLTPRCSGTSHDRGRT